MVIFRKFSVATWNLRLSMVNEFPDDEWTTAKLRKVLISLCKDGFVSKDLNNSRIGNSVWILEENKWLTYNLPYKGEYFDRHDSRGEN